MKEYKDMFTRAFDFKGKSSLKEFWICVLLDIIFSACCYFFALPFINDIKIFKTVGYSVSSLYSLVVFIPMLALVFRRLHDSGHSGWWILIALVPFFGEIVIIMFLCQPSSFSVNPWYNGYKQEDKTIEQIKAENGINQSNQETQTSQQSAVQNQQTDQTKNQNNVDEKEQDDVIKVNDSQVKIDDKPRSRGEKIADLQALRDNGAITKEEYEKSLFNILTK